MCLHELFPHSNHQQILKHSPGYAKRGSQAYRALGWQETINPRLQPVMSNTSKVLRVKLGLVQNIIFIHSLTSDFSLCVIALWSRKCACHQLASCHYKCSCLSLSCWKFSKICLRQKSLSAFLIHAFDGGLFTTSKTEPSKIITVTCGSSASGGRFSF